MTIGHMPMTAITGRTSKRIRDQLALANGLMFAYFRMDITAAGDSYNAFAIRGRKVR
jgi:hypothetical protein